MSDFGRMIAPFARRLGNLLARGVVTAANGTGKMRSLQIRMLSGETKDDVEHFEPYGFTSEPHAGAEHVTAFFDGDRSHGVTLVVADRRYRLAGLAGGEMAIYDDQGQKVHLTRAGIVIDGGNLPIHVQNAPTVSVTATGSIDLNAPVITLNGAVVQGKGGNGGDMQLQGPMTVVNDVTSGGKSLQHHVHSGVQAGGGNTGQPV